MFDGKTVLIAGGSGFIGVNLSLRLAGLGARVRATTLHCRPLLDDPRIEYVKADLTEAADCARAVAGCDYVFACAASTAGAAVMNATPLAQVTPNVVMNARLLEAAHQAGVKKFLFISSSAAYPPSADRPVHEDEMFEGDPYDVYFSVGWMKRYAELLCRTYAQKIRNPMQTLVIRPSNAFGPYDKFDPKMSHVTASLIRRVVVRETPFEVWGTGDDVRDLIYIDDLIDGMLAVFEQFDGYDAVNIAAGGTGHSIKEVIRTLLEIDGFTDADLRFDPSKPQTIPIRLIDTERAKSRYGFETKVSLRDGLARTVAWYRENRTTHPR